MKGKRNLSIKILIIIVMINIVTGTKIMVNGAINIEDKIATSSNQSFVIKKDGTLWAWGSDVYGSLGDGGKNKDKGIPVQILSDVQSIYSHFYSNYSFAIKNDGSLWGWGYNAYGQIGDGTKIDKSKPVKIMNDVKSVIMGGSMSFAIKRDKTLWGWGRNEDGYLGDGTEIDRLKPVKIMDNVVIMTSGRPGYMEHNFAIKSDGSLWAWGNNEYGKLGDGTDIDRIKPVKIMSSVAKIITASRYSFAIKKDGTLWGWGENGYVSYLKDKISLKPVKIMNNVQSISVDEFGPSNYVIKKDGTLWTWVSNGYGALEDENTITKFNPVKIMDSVKSISGDGSQRYVIKKDGTLWGWGWDLYHQLLTKEIGDYNEYIKNPVKLMDDVLAVKGHYHVLAVKKDGSLWSWGNNEYGQVGDGTKKYRNDLFEVMTLGSIVT